MGRPRKIAPGIGERIASLVPDGATFNEFADNIGVSSTAFGHYVRGEREPSMSFFTRMRETLGVDLNWLIDGVQNTVGVNSAATVQIPRYEIQASAGDGLSVLSEEVADYFTVSRDWIMRYCPAGAKLGLIEAKGDSMDPTIRDGDGLIIRLDVTRADVGSGGIFVLNYGGNLLVKRIQVQLDGTVIVASDNINYRTETLTPDAAEQLLDVRAQVLLNIAPPRSALFPR